MIADKQQFEGAFTHSFHIMNHTMTIMQHGEHFELRIDNVSFSHLHAQEQTKNQFVYEDGKKEEIKYPYQISKSQTSSGPNQKFDFSNKSGISHSSYDHPHGAPMMGFGNTPDRGPENFKDKFMEMTGFAKPAYSTKTTSYTVKHVQRRPGGPARRTKNVAGTNAAARGWDDVAEAKSQALNGDGDGNENNSPLGGGSGEKQQPGGAFDFDNWGKQEVQKAQPYDDNGGGFRCKQPPGPVSVKQAHKNAHATGVKDYGGIPKTFDSGANPNRN